VFLSGELGGEGVGQERGDAESGAEGVGVDAVSGAGVVVVGDLAGVIDQCGGQYGGCRA
jgi:hypothetical protein